MTKQEIVSYVRGFLKKEDATTRYHERFLIATIEDVLKEMYADLYKINPRLLDNYVKTYGNTTAIDVALEAITGIYYSTIPVKICTLPCKSSGVRYIYPVVKNTGNTFQPMDAREADLIFNTDVAIVTKKIGFRVKQDTRVDYYNMNSTILSSGVVMDLLVPFSEYTDEEVVNVPELTEEQGGTFITRVLTKLQVVPPAELNDNNASAKQPTNRQ